MSTNRVNTTQLQFTNDETDRVQMLVRRTTVEDHEDGLDDYRVAIVQFEPSVDDKGEPFENMVYSSLSLEECRALRNYLDDVLEEADCDDNCDEDVPYHMHSARPADFDRGVSPCDEEEGDDDTVSCGARECERCR